MKPIALLAGAATAFAIKSFVPSSPAAHPPAFPPSAVADRHGPSITHRDRAPPVPSVLETL